MSERPIESSCEIDGAQGRATDRGEAARTHPEDVSRVVRCDDFRWEGIDPGAYKEAGPGWRGVTRQALVGASGESAPFEVRYFEVAPEGYTTLERHQHHHVVIPIRGRGAVRLGDRWEEVGFGDVVYVAPGDPHQFRGAGAEPFGFLCVVSARRDPPQPLPPEPG